MVAYDQRVREKAMSKPALSAGPRIKSRLMPESPLFFLCCAPFLFDAATCDAVIPNSATTRVSSAQASAAKRADEKLIRTATFPKGNNDARWASMTQRGKPGGCATPSP